MKRPWVRVVGRVGLSLATIALLVVLWFRSGSVAVAVQSSLGLAIATWLATLFSILSLFCEAIGVMDQRAETRRLREAERSQHERFLASFEGFLRDRARRQEALLRLGRRRCAVD